MKFSLAVGLAGYIRADAYNRTRSAPENFLGDGTHDQFANATASMTTEHEQINVMSFDDLGECMRDLPSRRQHAVGESVQLARSEERRVGKEGRERRWVEE